MHNQSIAVALTKVFKKHPQNDHEKGLDKPQLKETKGVLEGWKPR